MDIDSSSTTISITDDDFSPLTSSPLIVTAWHTTQGFCNDIPVELEMLCREIEATGVSGAMHKEIHMGHYVYWSWKANWTIVAGLQTTYELKHDIALLNTRKNLKLPPAYDDFIEPASIMDLSLGDILLAKARTVPSGSAYIPSPSKIRSLAPPKLYQPIETVYGSDELFLKMQIVYPPLPENADRLY